MRIAKIEWKGLIVDWDTRLVFSWIGGYARLLWAMVGLMA